MIAKERLNKLAGYRVMLGLTQEDMGKLLGMSKQQYNPKELGKISFNDSEKLKIKKILSSHFPNITIDELFFN